MGIVVTAYGDVGACMVAYNVFIAHEAIHTNTNDIGITGTNRS